MARRAGTGERGADAPQRAPARRAWRETRLDRAARLDLLEAFRQDATKLRYARLGRTDGLLPLFGDAGRPLRARRAWRGPRDLAASTRCAPRCRCINHLQDCAKDYRDARPGLPAARHARERGGAAVEDLARPARRPALRAVYRRPRRRRLRCAARQARAAFAALRSATGGCGREVAVIQRLAERPDARACAARDPLAERVTAHGKAERCSPARASRVAGGGSGCDERR